MPTRNGSAAGSKASEVAAGLSPRDWLRELVAGLLAATAFLFCHYSLSFPHWQMPAIDQALEGVVAVASYAGVRLAWPTRPGLIERWLGLDDPLRPSLVDDDPETLRNALQLSVGAVRGQLTAPVQGELDRIVTAVDAVLAVRDQAGAGAELDYTLRATITRYVPDTLERYLRLPRRFAIEREIRDGATPRDLVVEQLRTLAEELESIAEEVHLGNAQDLAAHGRFLEARFNRQDPLR